MVRVGIIGLGMMGRTHYEAYQELKHVAVVAVADADPKRARGDLTGTAGNVLAGGLSQLPMDRIKGTTDWRELINFKDVDIVDVCVPTHQHAEVAIEALRAGKHVMCEKPLARTSHDAEHIAGAARESKGFFMPAMCIRFWPQWAWLKDAIDKNRYGKLLSANFRRVAQMPGGWYKDGKISGGAALDLHIHDTDFIQHILGMPRAVNSTGYSKTSGETDHIVTQYYYDDPPLVTAEGGWAMSDGFGFTMRYTANFERASVDYDLGREKPLMLYQNGTAEAVDCGSEYGYARELRYFTDCVRRTDRPTVVTADDAVRSIRIVEAEVRSVRSGSVVNLT
jgi:predicted dehydrogenase